MDKEDALIVFQKHIKASEEQYVKEKQFESKRIKRQERKIRESFMKLLYELHDRGLLASTSSWAQLYPMLSADQRFENMLLINGSTALDLFKFYVEDLKNKYYEDKKVINEVLDAKNFFIDESTTFECFQQWIRTDSRFKQLDPINMKFCFNELFDKVAEHRREAEREEQKKTKRIEALFWNLLRSLSPEVEPNSSWEIVRDQIKSAELNEIITDENIKKQFFVSYVKSLQNTCGHYHSTNINDRKRKKEKKRKHEDEVSDAAHDELTSKTKKKRKKEERDKNGETEKKKKKKQKKKMSESFSELVEL